MRDLKGSTLHAEDLLAPSACLLQPVDGQISLSASPFWASSCNDLTTDREGTPTCTPGASVLIEHLIESDTICFDLLSWDSVLQNEVAAESTSSCGELSYC